MEDTEKVLNIIKKEFEKIVIEQNTSNALDFINEIIESLILEYKVNYEPHKKELLYNVVRKEYYILKKAQENINVILDIYDGNF